MSNQSDFHRHACWDEDSAREVLTTEALEGSKATFLATHHPVRRLSVAITTVGRPPNTERDLLDVLSDQKQRHVFCVVEGEPGSGKSHLIRWLSLQWPDNNDFVILIQRADGSLDGTLRALQDALPESFKEIMQSSHSVQQTSFAGRVKLFHSHLAHSMSREFFEDEKTFSDVEWCAENALKEILHHQILEEWKAPERVLSILLAHENREQRDSKVGQFGLQDLVELKKLIKKLQMRIPSSKGIIFLRKLEKEIGGVILPQLQSGVSEESIRQQKIPESLKFLKALNQRINTAIQQLLGITPKGLKDVFLKLRKELKKQNKRLVLLLEDITNFQGIDRQLIDILVTNSQTRDDLCDLISVVGITPNYFQDHLSSLGNYVQRMTLRVRLGQELSGHSFQSVSLMEDEKERQQLAARYLNAIRLGPQRLLNWLASDSAGSHPPSACEGCSFRQTCHETFGEVSGIGLYPFNAHSLKRLYETLSDPVGGMTLQTPRGLIQGVLAPTLLEPRLIKDGHYPSTEIESEWIPSDSRNLDRSVERFIERSTDQEDVRKRLKKLLRWWGETSRALQTRSGPYGLSIDGIHKGVFHAFDLPWIGAEASEAQTLDDASSVGTEQRVAEVAPETSSTGATSPSERVAEVTAPTTLSVPSAGLDELQAQAQTELDGLLRQLATWRHGGRLENETFWRKELVAILSLLSWGHLGISEKQVKLFFEKHTSVRWEEASSHSDRRLFTVSRQEKWWLSGIDSWVSLKFVGKVPMTAEDEGYHDRQVARMMRHLSKKVRLHVDEHMPQLEEGGPWRPEETIAQILLVRAWTRGDVRPDASIAEWWKALFLYNEGAEGAELPLRGADWRALVEKTTHLSTFFQDFLEMVTFSAPSGTAYGPVEVCYILPALLRIKESFSLGYIPHVSNLTANMSTFERLSNEAREIHRLLSTALQTERERLLVAGQEIDTFRRGKSVKEMVEQYEELIREISRHLPSTSASRIRGWLDSVEKCRDEDFFAESSEKVIDFLFEDMPDLRNGEAKAVLWALVVGAPLREFTWTQLLFNQAEEIVKHLYVEATQRVESQSEGSSEGLSSIHEKGEKLTSLAGKGLMILEGRT